MKKDDMSQRLLSYRNTKNAAVSQQSTLCMLHHAMLCYVMLCYVMMYYVKLRYDMLYYDMS